MRPCSCRPSPLPRATPSVVVHVCACVRVCVCVCACECMFGGGWCAPKSGFPERRGAWCVRGGGGAGEIRVPRARADVREPKGERGGEIQNGGWGKREMQRGKGASIRLCAPTRETNIRSTYTCVQICTCVHAHIQMRICMCAHCAHSRSDMRIYYIHIYVNIHM